MQTRKQQLEPDIEQRTGSKLGKEYVKAVCCHPAYLTYAEYIMRNAGLDETQVESRLLGEISITSDKQMTPTLWQKAAEGKEELESLLKKVKEKSEKAGLKLSLQKMNIMASGLINLLQIDGK